MCYKFRRGTSTRPPLARDILRRPSDVEAFSENQGPFVVEPSTNNRGTGRTASRKKTTLKHAHGQSFDARDRVSGRMESSRMTKHLSDKELRAWQECENRLWEHERLAVEESKVDINDLLIIAGLISAVLTGFIVPLYVLLQPLSSDATTQALLILFAQQMAISTESSILRASFEHGNLTLPTEISSLSSTSTTNVPASTISTCSLWFAALICSLGAASIGIAVLLWLHHHLERKATTPRQSAYIWHMRSRGLAIWQVRKIIDVLPLLLQLAIDLFLIGLVQLLWTMNHIVAAISMALVAILLVISLGTALVPAFAPRCPYRSPLAWWWFLILRCLSNVTGVCTAVEAGGLTQPIVA